ncbi:MAG: cysteine desulfurase family protein [Planctomycetota bacterium]
MPREIYLDHNATTPLDPEVREEMERLLRDCHGNPSSLHGPGRAARRIVEEARERLADSLGAEAGEVYFTSGGTESNNLMILGVEDRLQPLYTTAVEHPSVLEPARRRWRQGVPGGLLEVDGEGRLREETPGDEERYRGALVSIQWVNNETGVIQDLPRWCRHFQERGAVVHTDGAQGFFRLPHTIGELGVDAATVTAHKSFGPVGVGALYLRRGLIVDPVFCGGPQERKVRPGTENILAIHGMGVLADIAGRRRLWPEEAMRRKSRRLRDLLSALPGIRILTPQEGSFPNTISVAFADLEAETLLVRLDMEGIAASSGSACSSGAREPSHVLRAMGVPDREIRGAVRLSSGPETTVEMLEQATARLGAIVGELRRRRR